MAVKDKKAMAKKLYFSRLEKQFRSKLPVRKHVLVDENVSKCLLCKALKEKINVDELGNELILQGLMADPIYKTYLENSDTHELDIVPTVICGKVRSKAQHKSNRMQHDTV